MGGREKRYQSGKKGIILESANFQGGSHPQDFAEVGLRTDASTRFEKALDPALAETAMMRILTVLLQFVRKRTINSVLVRHRPFRQNGKNNTSCRSLGLNQKSVKKYRVLKVILACANLGFGVGADQEEELEVSIPFLASKLKMLPLRKIWLRKFAYLWL
jgi:phenylalanyl-tRNA synthetase beta subunit